MALALSKRFAPVDSDKLPFTLYYPRVSNLISGASMPFYGLSKGLSSCQSSDYQSRALSSCSYFDWGVSIEMSGCHQALSETPPTLNGDSQPHWNVAPNKRACSPVSISISPPLRLCNHADYTASYSVKNCQQATADLAFALKNCGSGQFGDSDKTGRCAFVSMSLTQALKNCSNPDYSASYRPSCDWYEVEIPEPPVKDEYPCGRPPASDTLPFVLKRPNLSHANDKLPFILACDHSPQPIIKDTYMLYNTIFASIDGLPLGILSASITTSTDAFCWQCSIDISPKDFARLNLDTRTTDPIVTITLNGERWDFLIEDYSDNRAFINNSYSLKGRSKTAKLAGDYAVQNTEIVPDALNAQQLIDRQIHLLPFALEHYDATDWLIPANTYTVSGTPIDTIRDIATAGGHFVQSHRFEPKFSIKKRWKVAAWQVAATTADQSLPAAAILSISGDRRISKQCNGVFISGEGSNAIGGHVYRQNSNRQPEASAIKHPLYTAVEAIRSAGIAALSETGNHKTETVETLISGKYQIPRASLGEIWQINEPQTAFKGIVTGLAITVKLQNDAPAITQSITLDRYLGG